MVKSMYENLDINKEIKSYAKAHKISLSQFALDCNMPLSTLRSICERGISCASFSNAVKIFKKLGLSVESTGADGEISQEEKVLLDDFRSLDMRGKRSVEGVLAIQKQEMAIEGNDSFDAMPKIKSESFKDFVQITKRAVEKRKIKVFLQPAAAGLGNYVDDDAFEEMEFENVPKSAEFAVRISGDSMTPKIADGDIVFVEKAWELSSGDVGIYIIDGEAFCKKLIKENGKYLLRSENPKYHDFLLPKGAFLVGKVILA